MSFSLYQINLFFGGIILGIFQWTSFRKVLTEKGWKETSLWILGSMASIGLGVIIGTIVSGIMLNNSAQFGPRFAVEQVVTGVIYGISSGLIVLILLGKITRAQTNSEVVS